MVLDTSLLNTQQYKVHIKGKFEQSRERSRALPLHIRVVAIEKGAYWSPSTTVANFTHIYIYIYIYILNFFFLSFKSPKIFFDFTILKFVNDFSYGDIYG